MPAHITLKDIAKRARLSVSAVSMALRNHAEVSTETRQRVQALAYSMGYRRDPMLSALSAYRHGVKQIDSTLALITTGETASSWRTSYGEMLFAGAHQEARRLGYELASYWIDPAFSGERHSRILEARGVTGLLIAPLAEHQTHLDLDWASFPAVALGHTLRTPCLSRAQPDLYGGLLHTCRELQAHGYRRIGLVTSAETDTYIDGQWSAAMLTYQSSLPAVRRVEPLWHETYQEPAFLKWLDREEPDVIVAYGEPHYRWLTASGRRVPDDIGYVLLSDYPRAPQDPPFAALNHNFAVVGAAGISLLHTQCITHNCGVPAVRVSVVVDTTWVPGQTIRRMSVQVQ